MVRLRPDRPPVVTTSVGRWPRDLPLAKLEKVLPICGDRLSELAYDA